MKKSFLSLVAMCMFALASYAQSSQLATLNHNGQITTYYGSTALSKAHAAAVNGDVITLSSGSFSGVTINKAVTIRGAGMGMDTVSNALPTIINSNFTINISANNTSNLILEGIYHNGTITYSEATRPMFIKCRFKNFRSQQTSSVLTDATFMHCKIVGNDIQLRGSGSIINSILNMDPVISNYTITNSIILEDYSGITNSTLFNCIIGVYDTPLDGSNFVNNCIGFASPIGYYDGADIFDNLPINSTNRVVDQFSIFASYDFDVDEDDDQVLAIPDNEWFTLSATGKTYLGNDGKEVGIYGGNMPFDPRTTTPQITRCNVAAKSTADGKLSVDIEVRGVE